MTVLGEPKVAVRPGRDPEDWAGEARGELGDGARRGDAADPAGLVAEPEVAVGPGGDQIGLAAGQEARREHGNDARGRDPADRVAALLGEPEVAVGPGRDAKGLAEGRDARGELGD